MPRTTLPITIEIGAELTISGLPRDVEQAVITANRFSNPEFTRKERLGLWTGDTDREIRLYRRTSNTVIVPRGTFPIVARLCRDQGLPYQVIDETVAPALDVEVGGGGALFAYQQGALDALLRWPTGMLEAPTGSGKTNILLSAIPRLQTRTLILTHTAELFRQTRERCRRWLGVEPGALGGGKWDVRPIAVGMIQTLAKRDLQDIASYFGCVLVDECHHAPARTWGDVLNRLPARYKYGVTATAWRKDRLQVVMWRTISPITATVSHADVTAAGTVIAPDIETIPTVFFFDLVDSTEWGRMLSSLIRDADRNALIVEAVRTRLTPETRALILSDRVEHVYLLAGLLDDLAPVVLTGELSKPERDAGMAAVRAGVPLTIATSALLGEGIDVPGWDLLFRHADGGRPADLAGGWTRQPGGAWKGPRDGRRFRGCCCAGTRQRPSTARAAVSGGARCLMLRGRWSTIPSRPPGSCLLSASP